MHPVQLREARAKLAGAPARGAASIDRKVITLGLLLAVGFASGFGLSAEVSPEVRQVFPHRAKAAPGEGGGSAMGAVNGGRGGGGGGAGAGTGAGAGGAGGAGGGSGGQAKGGGTPAGEDEPRAGSAAGRGGEASGGDRPAAGSAPPGQAEAEDPPCRSVDVTGAEAAKLLSGNTANGIRAEEADPELLYFAPRGWIGRIRPSSIEVRAWSPGASSICAVDARGVSSCEVIRARRCLDADRDGFHLGDLQRPSGRWIPIVRGNVQNFPGYIPLLDEPRTEVPASPGLGAGALAGSRHDRATFPGGTTFQKVERGAHGPATVVYYADDGRRLTFARPSGEALRDGVRIEVGWWTFGRGVVCQGEGPGHDHLSCFAPKGGRGGHLTLASTSRQPAIDLAVVADLRPAKLDED